jgi:hypothetical protein
MHELCCGEFDRPASSLAWPQVMLRDALQNAQGVLAWRMLIDPRQSASVWSAWANHLRSPVLA